MGKLEFFQGWLISCVKVESKINNSNDKGALGKASGKFSLGALYNGLGNSKLYKSWIYLSLMEEMVTIPRVRLIDLERKAEELEKLKRIDFDLIKQFEESLEDVKAGRIRRVA